MKSKHSLAFEKWLKLHPEAVLTCPLCKQPLGRLLIREGILAHIRCKKGRKIRPVNQYYKIHTNSPYSVAFAKGGIFR